MQTKLQAQTAMKQITSKHWLMLCVGLSTISLLQVSSFNAFAETASHTESKKMPMPPAGPYRSSLHAPIMVAPQMPMDRRQWTPSLPPQWHNNSQSTVMNKNNSSSKSAVESKTNNVQAAEPQAYRPNNMMQQPAYVQRQWMPTQPQWGAPNAPRPNWNNPYPPQTQAARPYPVQPNFYNQQWNAPVAPQRQAPRYVPPRYPNQYQQAPRTQYNRPMPPMNNFSQPPRWQNPMPPQFRPW